MSGSVHETAGSFERKAQQTVKGMGDTASRLAEKASERFDQIVEGAEDQASKLAEQGRDATQRVGQVAGNMRQAIDKSVTEQPMTTLAVAAAVGFVLGALWKS